MDDIKIKQLEAEANLYQSLALQLLANGHKEEAEHAGEVAQNFYEAAARDFNIAASKSLKVVNHYRKKQGLEDIDIRPT